MSRLYGPATFALALATFVAVVPVRSADAQGWRNRIKGAAKGAIDQATGDAAKKTTSKPAAGDSAASPAASGAVTSAKPGNGVWTNYDFKPGDKTLFADDFSQDVVGNFPRRLELKNGTAEIVEWQGKRWLSAPGTAEFYIPLGQTLPQRFTVEFDLTGSGNGMTVAFEQRQSYRHDPNSDWLVFGTWFAGLHGVERDATSPTGYNTDGTPVHVAIQVDGDYAKVYVNERRVSNVPNGNLGRWNKIYMDLNGWNEKSPRMIANLRVMGGGRPLYDALSASGRVATQGIYFTTGSDQLRPESSPTLKEIGAMLADHPELKLTIEGHTDNAGDAAANQALSQQRAEAVKQTLVTTYHVDAARLTAAGLGASKPAAPNATAEGRQTNRRVELVRQ